MSFEAPEANALKIQSERFFLGLLVSEILTSIGDLTRSGEPGYGLIAGPLSTPEWLSGDLVLLLRWGWGDEDVFCELLFRRGLIGLSWSSSVGELATCWFSFGNFFTTYSAVM